MTDAAETKLSGSNLGKNTVEGSLQACIGECDKDEDCATGLLCFQRSNGEDIPGCTGDGGGDNWCVLSSLSLRSLYNSNFPVAFQLTRFLLFRDYCYDPDYESPTPSLTHSPTAYYFNPLTWHATPPPTSLKVARSAALLLLQDGTRYQHISARL